MSKIAESMLKNAIPKADLVGVKVRVPFFDRPIAERRAAVARARKKALERQKAGGY